jgi:outer membrane protein OmpA-like peptidoglycan-associated protein
LRLLGLVFLALVAAGCCAPRKPVPMVASELFAVIPSPANGHVGAIVVHRNGQAHVIDSAYGAERVRSDGALETARIDDAEVKRVFGPTLDALPGRPTSYTLYFLEGKDELTPESRVELEKVFADLKHRPLPDIVVIGHTDTVGGLPFNDKLSLARAERMREMMIALGIPAERIQAAGRGKRELLVPTEDNVSEPRNRRVEINVR